MSNSCCMINYDVDQKRARLISIEEEGDVDSQIASLADEALNLNVQRLDNALQIKVKLSFIVSLLLI